VLPSTSGTSRADILAALERLEAGGSTNGAQGIELAYREAESHFERGAINRVILATDGDFNVGVSSQGELVRLIEQKRRSGVYLTVLGFGRGNLGDARMEALADAGNGNYGYIDSVAEARRLLVREAGATLVPVADDVKIQIEFNPSRVAEYRLLGYENRLLQAHEFDDDRRDAGEVGAGHTVTALYEVVPVGAPSQATNAPTLRYQTDRSLTAVAGEGELLNFKIRFKPPGGSTSQLAQRVVQDVPGAEPSVDFRFATAVAGFGMWLRRDPLLPDGFDLVGLTQVASQSTGLDSHGDRHELVSLMHRARDLPR
jgi:Ca-activated chloride channel family protein